MGYTYIFRQGSSDVFKLGKANTLVTRTNSLRTGNKELELFDHVETDHPLKGEQFLKARWAGRKRHYRSEFYRLTEDEVRAGMTALQHYLDEVLPGELEQAEELAELETADHDATMIEPSDEVAVAHRKLVAIESELRRLEAEAEPLRREILLAIGKNRGITGIATYDKADSVRWLNAERLEADHPELCAQFQKSTLDKTLLRRKHPDLAEAYTEPAKKRTFFLNEDLGD